RSLSPRLASSSLARSILSSSTSDLPVGRPWARRKVYAMAPPINRRSTTLPRFWMTSILSDTLAPPRIATHGRGGLVVAIPRYFSSCSMSSPAAACATYLIMPSVEACARCAEPNAEMSLRPVAARLEQLLGRPVKMAPDCVGPEVETMKPAPGEVLLLENLRFHPEEEKNDPAFAQKLAALCDLYVNDAFGSAHRAHASTEGMIKFVPQAAAGLLMEQELKYLGMATTNPPRPCVAILGGAKVSDKIEVIQNLGKVVD